MMKPLFGAFSFYLNQYKYFYSYHRKLSDEATNPIIIGIQTKWYLAISTKNKVNIQKIDVKQQKTTAFYKIEVKTFILFFALH